MLSVAGTYTYPESNTVNAGSISLVTDKTYQNTLEKQKKSSRFGIKG